MEGPPQEEPEDLEQKPEDTESMSEVQEQNQENLEERIEIAMRVPKGHWNWSGPEKN